MKHLVRIVMVIGLFVIGNGIRVQSQITYKSGFDTRYVVREAQLYHYQLYHTYVENVPELIRFINKERFVRVKKSRSLTDKELESGITERMAVELGIMKVDTLRPLLTAYLLGEGVTTDALRADNSLAIIFKEVTNELKKNSMRPFPSPSAEQSDGKPRSLQVDQENVVPPARQSFPCPKMLRRPSYQSRNGGYIELMGIERWTNGTVVNLKFFRYGKVDGLSVDNNFYLTDKTSGRKYKARYVMNVAYDPGYTYISSVKNEILYFQIVFPVLPDGISSLDLTWPGSQGGFDFYGIDVRSLFNQPAPSSCNLPQTGYDTSELRRTSSTVKIQINRYKTNYQFYDGMLTVYNKDLGGYGFIDEKGIVRTKFEWYYPFIRMGHDPRFGGGYCLIAKRINQVEYWYIIDKNGNVTADLGNRVADLTPFNKDGYANIVIKEGGEFKVMVIDGHGREVFPHLSRKPVYPSSYPHILNPFYEGLAAFQDPFTGKWGFIDRTGKIVIPAQYDFVDKFSEGLAAVLFKATDGRPSLWGYIDHTGKIVIQPMFENQPGCFSEGLVIVTKRNKNQVVMDRTGKILSEEWRSIMPFKQGRSIVNGMYVVDRDMNIVNGPFINADKSELTMYPDSYCQGMFRCYSWTTRFVFPNGYFYRHTNIQHVSDRLLHYHDTRSGIDGFVNPRGDMIFEFVESEF